ncbi:hypothetical protein [Flavobacterium wongokense]|uniref:hypothetical protein n=1 Tax=Flavobacterium wongokense TaxID=2910674 RepID=UPI001F32C742|nr:hypothetical protein [Flavobacterium sp. WG47]MCF6131015.1 hypothetical protein [Flavobacterium sp. WG47]
MKNFTLYLAMAACLLASKLSAQEEKNKDRDITFEMKVKLIANKIDAITKEEKAALKIEIEDVNKELEAGTITKAQADEKKMQLAEIRSKNIETRVGQAQDELKDVVKQKVDGKLKSDWDHFSFRWGKGDKTKQDSIRNNRSEARTTSQFVFAAGVNNLVTDGAVAHSDYRYWGSHFYEWGFTNNTRLFKNDNLLHLKYGFSVMYNNLRPTQGRYFVANGNQTDLEYSPVNLKDSRFRNVYVTAPIHLEFDFTKTGTNADGKKLFRTHESLRFGIGGYAGFRVKSKQILKYNDEGHNNTIKQKGGFNTEDFIYGVSTYLGYGATSLYLKYDLNPLFKDNAIKQNNISLGVRFDLN